MAGGLFNISTSAGIIFVLSRLIHARYKRERLLLELSEANRQLRLAALREADLATLRERNRLAREMHDSLGHALVSIAVKLEAVRLLYSVDAARADTELGETTHLVRATMTDLRRSLAGLGPAALEEQPLCHALAELAREMGRRTGVQTTYSIDEDVALLDRGIQETLYRVGQEALTNIAKHAQAQHIMLRLDVRNGMALLEVGDDGVGLGAAPHSGSLRFGVRGMRERVEALGGTLTLGPRTEGGTVVRARIPAPVSI
jgi:signal transduction histidine kinase